MKILLNLLTLFIIILLPWAAYYGYVSAKYKDPEAIEAHFFKKFGKPGKIFAKIWLWVSVGAFFLWFYLASR